MRISVIANKRHEELLDLSVKALELAIEIRDEQGVMDDENIPDPYSLKSDWT